MDTVAAMIANVGIANIQCRDSPSAMGPAISVPSMPPPTNNPLTTPMATWDCPDGMCLRTRMNDSGIAPTIAPCRICPSSSTHRFGASADTIPPPRPPPSAASSPAYRPSGPRESPRWARRVPR
ncbi:hypothetical protein LUX39_51675 [Actinomadura madurae]|nr:hypothetical protein [Actinomadura madurae]MCQ0021085.1 hypothetical protein [Actinomadura madurae]